MRPYILAEANWKDVKNTDFELAVLPWGATEAHNYHLPYGTDNIEADCIAGEAARIAWEKGTKLIVLPNIPFGVNTGQRDIKLDVNLYPSTQMIILTDIIEMLDRHGIRKLVILNSHGGNDFRAMIRELGAKFPSMFICQCNWYQYQGAESFFDVFGNHADEMETSLLLYLTPHLLRPLDEAGDGVEKQYKVKTLRKSWFWAERRWTQVTEDTGIGNPKAATKEKGEKFFKAITENVAELFVELTKVDPNDLYE